MKLLALNELRKEIKICCTRQIITNTYGASEMCKKTNFLCILILIGTNEMKKKYYKNIAF